MSVPPFIGEIQAVGYSFAPKGWALCDGQLLPISQNTALFSILGTTYGGNGTSNFALPNFQGASPMQQGQGPGLTLRDLGEMAGEQTVTLIQSEMPVHTHGLGVVDAPGTQNSPSGALLGKARYGKAFDLQYAPSAGTTMSSTALAVAGGGLPHNNMPPYLVVNFVIALQGVFPPRS